MCINTEGSFECQRQGASDHTYDPRNIHHLPPHEANRTEDRHALDGGAGYNSVVYTGHELPLSRADDMGEGATNEDEFDDEIVIVPDDEIPTPPTTLPTTPSTYHHYHYPLIVLRL